jgi:hypothetical protein
VAVVTKAGRLALAGASRVVDGSNFAGSQSAIEKFDFID